MTEFMCETWEDLPPDARLMLAIYYENRVQGGDGLEIHEAAEIAKQAIAEFGDVTSAAEGVRSRAMFMKQMAGGDLA